MRIWMLAAGAAALAITSPTLAERGGQGVGKGQGAQKAERGGQAKANRGGNRQVRAEKRAGDRARSQPQRFTQREDRGRLGQGMHAGPHSVGGRPGFLPPRDNPAG